MLAPGVLTYKTNWIFFRWADSESWELPFAWVKRARDDKSTNAEVRVGVLIYAGNEYWIFIIIIYSIMNKALTGN